MMCDEQWLCSLEAWIIFCESCVHLREFNWFAAPIGNDFLNEFANSLKPQLIMLTVSCGYIEAIPEHMLSEAMHRRQGFRLDSKPPLRMLEACPALEELHVIMWARTHRSASMRRCITDDFLVWVAEKCSQLRKLVIFETDFLYANESRLNTTDEGFTAVSRCQT